MRKSAKSTISDKVYTPHSLEITGDKIKLLEPKRNTTKRIFTKRTLNITSSEEEEPYSTQKPCQIHLEPQKRTVNNQSRKLYLKTSITDYKNTEVLNKVLKQIRETSKIEDFERILQSLCHSENTVNSDFIRKNKRDRVLEAIEGEAIYEEFFGQYIEDLRRVVNEAKEEDHQN